MGDQSILFSGPMIRALLDDRKTQTRRLVAPRWATGDLVWVRENHYLTDDGDFGGAVYAADPGAATSHLEEMAGIASRHPDIDWSPHTKLRPSIHMPRWASRLTLEIVAVRQERLEEISEADALAEGIRHWGDGFHWEPNMGWPGEPVGMESMRFVGSTARQAYMGLWEEINGRESLDANPPVWVTTFTAHKLNIDALRARTDGSLDRAVRS